MKKILYIYLLLISSSIGAMQQPANKNQMNNKKTSLNVKQIGSIALVNTPF